MLREQFIWPTWKWNSKFFLPMLEQFEEVKTVGIKI